MSIFSNISNYFKTSARNRRISRAYGDIETVIKQRVKQITDDNKNVSTTGLRVVLDNVVGKRIITGENLASNWNFTDMFEAYKVEGYLKYSVDTYIESSLKNGFTFASKNPSVVSYLKMRHQYMALVSGVPTYDLFRRMLFSLVLYGNALVHKYRNAAQSPGNPYVNVYGANKNPIAVLDIEDPRTAKISKKKSNMMYTFDSSGSQTSSQLYSHILTYNTTYATQNKNVPVPLDDVLHMRFHPQLKEKWAVPPFAPAIADIEAVRLIEENIELLVFQYGHPFLHAKVGSDKHKATKDEIDDVVRSINLMESNGFLATGHDVSVAAVDTSKGVSNIEKYLTYFKYRLYTELWLSPITTGEGGSANRATASTIDKLKQNKTIELQSILADYYQSILIEMLLEGGAPLEWILRPENIPSLKFPAVALDDKIMFENNIINQYNSNLITNAEARAELGRDPLTKDESADLREGRAAALDNSTSTSTATSTATSTTPESTKAQIAKAAASSTPTTTGSKAASNATQPENQYGKKAGPTQAQNA